MSAAKIHDFNESLLAEKKVLALLSAFWKGRGFRQVTAEPAFQSLDVDFVYTPARSMPASTLPAEVWVEMKADGTPYHNIFLELVSNGTYGIDTPGCFMFSQAFAWAYVFESTKEMFVFELQPVREWVFKNFLGMKPLLKTTRNKANRSADGEPSPTMGIAFPVRKFLEDLSGIAAITYLRLPGFGQPVAGIVPRPRLPASFAHLDRGLDGVIALLDAAPASSAPTPVKHLQAHTSRLRHKIIPLKSLAIEKTNNLPESVKEKALGPHYLLEAVCA